MTTSFYQYTYEELKHFFNKNELPSSGPNLLFNWHYKKRKLTPCVENLAKSSIEFVKSNFTFDLPEIHTIHQSHDKTVKFLFKLKDNHKIESVLIPFQGKYTLCLSSQVGCAMNCSFCFTGTQGLKRNLTTDEIVGQLLKAQIWLTQNRPQEDKILNLVFMGQGEPLHNFDAVKNACEIFMSQNGTSLACAKITISTAGYLPGLIRWKDEMPNVNIALSLHSPFTEKRNKLIPLNKKYPLSDVLKLVDDIPYGKNRFVTYEYLLIKDFNDSIYDAQETGKLLQGKKAYINLIPFNPFPGAKYERPRDESIEKFKLTLDPFKIPTLVRSTKGDQILAACGQLNTSL